jgi:hypothetical protein
VNCTALTHAGRPCGVPWQLVKNGLCPVHAGRVRIRNRAGASIVICSSDVTGSLPPPAESCARSCVRSARSFAAYVVGAGGWSPDRRESRYPKFAALEV